MKSKKKKILTIAILAVLTTSLQAKDFKAVIIQGKNNFLINEEDKNPDIPDTNGWLPFLQAHNNLNAYNNLSEVQPSDSFYVTYKNYLNSDLPNGEIGVPVWANISLRGNRLNNIDFLNGVQINGYLNLASNNISTLNPLPQTNFINLNLSDNNLNDLSLLSHLKQVDYLYLSDNPFTSIKPLENLEYSKKIDLGKTLNELNEYTNKLPEESSFCQNISKRNIYLHNGYSRLSGLLLCDIDDPWINFLNSQNANSQNALDISAYENKAISLTAKNLSDEDIPLYPLNVNSLSSLNLRNNNITQVDFLTEVTSIDSLLLDNNPISDIGGLSNIVESRNIYLPANGTFDSFEPFYNLTSGSITVNRAYDDFKELLEPLDYSSPFCQAIANGRVNIFQTNNELSEIQICSTGDLVMDFLHNHNQVLTKTTQNEIDNKDVITLNSKKITNDDIPAEEFWTIGKVNTFNIVSNELTNISFFGGFSELPNTLNASNNKINDLNGLSKLTSDGETIYLNNNEIVDLRPLSNFSKLSTLNLSNNKISSLEGLNNLEELTLLYLQGNEQSFDDLLPLKNLIRGNIYLAKDIEYYKQYNSGFIIDESPICEGLASDNVSIYANNSKLSNAVLLCQTDDVMNFLHKNGQLTKYIRQDQVNSSDSITLNNIKSNEFPTKDKWNISDINNFSIRNSSLENLDLLPNLDVHYQFNVTNNKLKNISGLANINFAGNNLSVDLRGAENSFTDLSPLQNINKGIIRVQNKLNYYDQYNNGFDINSPICDAFSKGAIDFYENTSTVNNAILLCNTDEVLKYLHKNKTLTNILRQSDVTNSDRISLTNINESEFPEASKWTMNNIYSFTLRSSQINNLDFLPNLNIGYNVILSDNNLNDISGLSNFNFVGTNKSVDLRGVNNTFTDLTALKNMDRGVIRVQNDMEYYDQYNTGFDWDSSPICDGLASGAVSFYFGSSQKNNAVSLCQTDLLMNFFHKNNAFTQYRLQSEIKSSDTLRLVNIESSDIPSRENWTFTELNRINIENSNLGNLDFLPNMTIRNSIDFANSNLIDISALNNINYIGSSIIDLRGASNTFTSLNGLRNFSSGNIYLPNDLSYYNEFTNKFDASSPICQAIESGSLTFYGESKDYSKNLCN